MAIIKAVKDAYRQGTGGWNVPMLALRARYLYGQQRPAVRAMGEGLVVGSSLAGALLANAAYDLSSPETLIMFLAGMVGGSVLSGLEALVRPLTGLTGLAYPTKTFGKKGLIKISGKEFKVSKDLQEGSEFEKVFSDTKSEIGMIVETAGEDGKISLRDFLNAMDGKLSAKHALALYTQITAGLLALGRGAKISKSAFFDKISIDKFGNVSSIVGTGDEWGINADVYAASEMLFDPLFGKAANFDKQGRVFRKILAKLQKAFKNKKIKDQNIVILVLLRLFSEYNPVKSNDLMLKMPGFAREEADLSGEKTQKVDKEVDIGVLEGRVLSVVAAAGRSNLDLRAGLESIVDNEADKAAMLISLVKEWGPIEGLLTAKKKALVLKMLDEIRTDIDSVLQEEPARVPMIPEIKNIVSSKPVVNWQNITSVYDYFLANRQKIDADSQGSIINYLVFIVKYYRRNTPQGVKFANWANLLKVCALLEEQKIDGIMLIIAPIRNKARKLGL